MHAKPQHLNRRVWHYPNSMQLIWIGLGLALVAVVAIVAVTQFTPAPSLATVPVVQSVPDAAQQGVEAYLQAHTTNDAARRAALYEQRANSPWVAPQQLVPDAAQQGVAAYLQAHTASDAARRAALYEQRANSPWVAPQQAVPDAAAQGVASYLRAHGAGGQAVVDRSFHTPPTSDYRVDRSFHTPQTSDYPGVNSRVSPQPTPDFKY
jgi:hypothetical protein